MIKVKRDIIKTTILTKFEIDWAKNMVPRVARTTESIFHQNIIIMLAPGDKGSFEKYINANFSDFKTNWRKLSKFEKNFFSKSTCHF